MRPHRPISVLVVLAVLVAAARPRAAEIYKVRLGGTGNTFSASPVASDGRIYALTEGGDTSVFAAGDEYRELAKNSLAEMSFASPAADGSSLYIRTATKLYRLVSDKP